MKTPPLRLSLMLAGLLLSAAWIGVTTIWFSPPGATTAAPQVGFPAPDFELDSPGGGPIRLSDYRGQVVLVNVWASWCPPCRAEMPDLQRVYTQRRDEGFVVLAVNATAGDTAAAAQAFFTAQQLSFPLLLDSDGQFSATYQVQLLPTSILIDRDGIVRGRFTGAINAALLNSELDALAAGGD